MLELIDDQLLSELVNQRLTDNQKPIRVDIDEL